MELLKHLASNEQLIPVYEKAKQKSIELDKKKKAKQAAAGKWIQLFIHNKFPQIWIDRFDLRLFNLTLGLSRSDSRIENMVSKERDVPGQSGT